MPVAAALGVVVLAFVALAVYERFAGEHPVADLLYDIWLRRQDLAADCADTDILINNAGAIPGGNIAQIDEARWREAWDLKVFGYINMTRRFYALMAARRAGVIVNILGAAGENPDFDYVAGSSGNASLMAFTRGMGGTSLVDKIRIVACNPGLISTERMETMLRATAKDKLNNTTSYAWDARGNLLTVTDPTSRTTTTSNGVTPSMGIEW